MDRLRLSRRLYEVLLEEARAHAPEECCGLLGGRDGEASELFPATNELHSTTAYEIPPAELFAVFRKMRELGLDLVGIYHSHPATENFPSARDRERAYYPDTACVILSPAAPRPVRAFLLGWSDVREIEIEVVG